MVCLFTAFAISGAMVARVQAVAPLLRHDGHDGSYITVLKQEAAVSSLTSVLSLLPQEPDLIYRHVPQGFAMQMDRDTLTQVRMHPDECLT